jgi:3-hydroxyisobutyrate dehydrogenase-like beta-hydroxyacid dehydrogenase
MNTAAAGFIGLGRIGAPMAKRVAAAGIPLTVFDIADDARLRLAGVAAAAGSAAEVGDRCDVVIGCLQTEEQYRDALLGDAGLARGSRVKTYVHVGTSGRAVVEYLAATLRGRGIETLDAPISGGVARATDGTLVTLASGPDTAFGQALPCLRSWSRSVVRLGDEPGLAQVMKLVNNMLSAANLAMAAEVMVVGARAGLTPAQMLEVINHGTGENNATRTKIPDQIVTRRFACGSTLANVMKDLSAYAQEAHDAGVTSAMVEAVVAVYRAAHDQESATADISTVVRPFERAAGCTLGPVA